MKKSDVQRLQDDLTKVMKDWSESMDYVAKVVPGGTYDSNSVRFKIEVAEVSSDGEVQTTYVRDFKRMAKLDGIDPELLGKPIQVINMTGKLTGYNSKARKYPYQFETDDGKQYKLSVAHVKVAKVLAEA